MASVWSLLRGLTFIFLWLGVSANFKVKLDDLLRLKEHNPALHPGPTKVNVSLALHSITVDTTNQVVGLSGQLTQVWHDFRLSFAMSLGNSDSTSIGIDSIGIPGVSGWDLQQRVWRPDVTAAEQEVTASMTDRASHFLRIKRNGVITWTQRVRYSVPCALSFTSYPLGGHVCKLTLSSAGYEMNELEPEWSLGQSVQAEKVVVSHGFSVANIKTSAKSKIMNAKHMRVLELSLELSANIGWMVKHTVIPMCAAVTTAYLAFFISAFGSSARLITVMTAYVTAAIFHENTYRNVPPSSSTMAIELFTGTCLTFIFLALLETVVVMMLAKAAPTSASGRRRVPPSPRNSFDLDVSDFKPDLTEGRSEGRGPVAALWVDRCFRVLYPTAFLILNVVYWILYN